MAGLVEIPCVKRNTVGAGNALIAADMALAGIVNKIPADEVVEAMNKVPSITTRIERNGFRWLSWHSDLNE